MRFSLATLAVVAGFASSASALNILGLVNLSPNILTPGNKLINLDVIADVLSESLAFRFRRRRAHEADGDARPQVLSSALATV